MSSFVNPLEKYPLGATPRSTRSGAASSQTPDMGKDSRKSANAAPLPAKTSKAQQTASSRRSQATGGRRSNRSSSGEEADDAIAQNGNGKGKGKKAQPDLAPVGEEDSDEVESSAVSSNAARQQLNSELEHDAIPDSPNGHDVSGATLLPGDSDADGGEIDAIAMVESLPNLQAASSRLLDFFSSSFSSPSRIADLARNLANPKSSQTRKLQYLSNNFSSQVELFGSDVYISVDKVASIFPPIDHDSKTWRVDGIIYKSNCAQLALEILTRITMTEDVEESLYALEGQFPLPFLSALANENLAKNAGISALRRQTFDLALQVRTQFLKMRLIVEKDVKGLDPNLLLHDVFYNENLDSQASAEAASSLRGFSLPSFQDVEGNLPEQYVQDVTDRIREITACFKADGQVDFDALDERFPWEEFIFTVAKWLRSRTEELNRHLERQPRVEDILDKLENAINQGSQEDTVHDTEMGDGAEPASQSQKASQQQRRELLPPAEIRERREAGERQSFGGFQNIVALARAKERLSTGGKQTTPDFGRQLSKLTSKPTARRSLPVTPASRHPRGSEASATPGAQLDSGDLGYQRAVQGRANGRQPGAQAFIDRQTNATRVSPIDSQRLGDGIRSSRKRAREDDVDEDEDGEFESDDRRLDIHDRRAQKPVQTAKRPRHDLTDSLAARAGPSDAQGRDVVLAAPQPSQASPIKVPQTRRPWTREEDEQFIRLVEEYGISWSKIKSQDELSGRVLHLRKQVDLKDRARNIVMIRLKGGTPYEELPKNFELVPLKTADIENLRKRNIQIPERVQRRQTNYFL
ncbi:hypothetical protein EYB25_009575 [Talaromyces marneffei]|uniref:uncharacterized protein n=1 Tax=Talaromyces marneffei TaxID=37727 RepID=UPI0012A959ED|nr:uncharacterized protein EYB26_008843 [Talaromyces marneffei]KAE8547782.1 hypothetical protein EYB25_009575 [Talaromyces marneffei]QGA21133.1 hypothetical protein EYB26_008843 [Talaromyces marneffei]